MAAKQTSRECLNCGVTFIVTSRKPNKKFCSLRCSRVTGPRNLSDRFLAKVHKTDTCWLWTGSMRGYGYGKMKVNGEEIAAHRVSYANAFGPFDESLFVCHHCDVPSCVNPAHLFLGTHDDNMRDCKEKGRQKTGNHKGPANGRAILSVEQVKSIRADTRASHLVALDYGVKPITIRAIRTGRNWSSVR